MNKNVITWIEGDGTVRTVFRKLALLEYTSMEKAKARLLIAIGKDENQLTPNLVQYALDKRKMDIQWISLYLPGVALSVPVLFVFYTLLISHLALYLYAGITVLLTMSLFFRMTCFSLYQKTRRFIYLAADSLLREIQKEMDVQGACPGIGLIESANFSRFNSAAVTNQQELVVMPPTEPEAAVSLEVPETSSKGGIAIVLLNELIQKECGRPNIYKGNTQNALAYYTHITGCQLKNLQGKVKYYKNREAINLSTPNIRATHKKYLDILLAFYETIDDDALYNKAEDLQAFIENSKNRKK